MSVRCCTWFSLLQWPINRFVERIAGHENIEKIHLEKRNNFYLACTKDKRGLGCLKLTSKGSHWYYATSCNQGSLCHGQAILYPKDQGSVTSIQWISSKTATTIHAIQFLLEKQCPSPLTPPPCHHYVSSLLLKSSLTNMEMSSEAWKKRPKRPFICFNSTNILFHS